MRLNATGDGLSLEVEADPPQALMNVLRRTKWDIVAALRRHEIDRRRPLITGWINDHFVSTPLGVCRHCGEGAKEGDRFVRLYCGDDSGDVHTTCEPVWREAEEAKARVAVGLAPLTGLLDCHFPLLYDIEEARPDDVNDAQWDVTMRGLRTFLATGRADEALQLGWSRDELFRVPPVWARVDLCGLGLLIGDRDVTEVTPTRIEIKTASGATQSLFRRLGPDLALVCRERLRLFGPMLAVKKFNCGRLNTRFASAATIATAISKLQRQRCYLPSSAPHHRREPRLNDLLNPVPTIFIAPAPPSRSRLVASRRSAACRASRSG